METDNFQPPSYPNRALSHYLFIYLMCTSILWTTLFTPLYIIHNTLCYKNCRKSNCIFAVKFSFYLPFLAAKCSHLFHLSFYKSRRNIKEQRYCCCFSVLLSTISVSICSTVGTFRVLCICYDDSTQNWHCYSFCANWSHMYCTIILSVHNNLFFKKNLGCPAVYFLKGTV